MTKNAHVLAAVVSLVATASCGGGGVSSAPTDLGTWTPGATPSGAASTGASSTAAGSSTGSASTAGASASSPTGASSASSATGGDGTSAASGASVTSTPGAVVDAGAPGTTVTSADGGLPCDVATVLASKCTACHSDPPINNSLSGLVTVADLLATAKEDPTKNEAQLSLARMQNTASPMPPATLNAPASGSDIATLQSWISAGYPGGSCASDGGPASDAAPAVALFDAFQGSIFKAGTGSNSHNAGRDCMSCHAGGGGEAPRFSFGGTVYDGKGAAVGGAEVRVVDSKGVAISVYTGSNGTFHSSTTFGTPAHVGVRTASTAMNMISGLTYGGCSKCHGAGTGYTTAEVHVP